ncbi:MAG: UDP-N-acetylmuramoyl-L-alanine--D-glutamate ligase [Polyangia bacterium]|nr:UDP-N-acetylmuramoyl-L-alanine--D-glutamate ligase [Polyangia bacterium]
MHTNQMELTDRRVLVVGLGRSGQAAARLCARRGARVTVNDHRGAEALGEVLGALPPGVGAHLGDHPVELFVSQDLIVLSPGVPALGALEAARRAGVEILGEIELAARFVSSDIVGITGTNGKSTVTTWIGDMLSSGGRPLFVGGNLGEPLSAAVDTPAAAPGGICVVELSSFQLETCVSLRPRAALLLNLDADHLDRYPDMASYGAAKARIFACQDEGDWAITNWDQPLCRRFLDRVSGQVAGFGLQNVPPSGATTEGDRIVISLPGRSPVTLLAARLRLVGRHNLENALASALAAVLLGAEPGAVQESLDTFRGLPHRMELVGEVDGVRFYNDSKATNVSAVAGSLGGFPDRFVWVAGGRHKGAPYTSLRGVLGGQAKAIVLIGEAADLIAADLEGVAPVFRAGSLEEAVGVAARLAASKEAVVLSPACSSYDMFSNFEERGACFAAAVMDLGRRSR